MIIEEIANYLESQNLITVGEDAFLGFMPNDPDNCMAIVDTGGLKPDLYIPVRDPLFQIKVRTTDYGIGWQLLEDIRNTLQGINNATLSDPVEPTLENPNPAQPTYFYLIDAVAEGGYIGRDEANRDLFSINFHCKIR